MKENKTEDNGIWMNSVSWKEAETRLSVIWLGIRICGVLIAIATTLGGVYFL